jgi:hypothetical protein
MYNLSHIKCQEKNLYNGRTAGERWIKGKKGKNKKKKIESGRNLSVIKWCVLLYT